MKKNTKTLQEQVDSRSVKITNKITWFGYNFLAHLPFFAPKYRPKYNIIDNPKDCPTGCFVIWNHLSRRDYLFLEVMMYPRPFNMVAGYSEFFRSHLAPLFKAVNVIPKKPFYNKEINPIINMKRILKAGGVITFSPEGSASFFGDNQPPTPGTAAFIKKMGVPVYFCDYHGLYLSSNKVDMVDKRGHVELTMYKLFTPEDLKEKSVEEIESILTKKFDYNDYEWNKEKQYVFKAKKGHMADNLDEFIYKCPKCGKEHTIVAKNDSVYCTECGNGFKFDNKYNITKLHEDDVIPSNPAEWARWERHHIIQEIRKDPNYEFRSPITIGGLPDNKYIKHKKLSVIQGEGEIIINHQGLHFVGTRWNKPYEAHMSWDDVYCPAVEDTLATLTFYPDGKPIDAIIKNKMGGKITMLIQEMHRLHVNAWKNFPWLDYMYEDLDKEPQVN